MADTAPFDKQNGIAYRGLIDQFLERADFIRPQPGGFAADYFIEIGVQAGSVRNTSHGLPNLVQTLLIRETVEIDE
jgi:hypothetical protein